jgi:hypothetical protein
VRAVGIRCSATALPPPFYLIEPTRRPPNGKPYALNLVNGVIYTATAQGCGGTPNNFYSYDLATKKVGNWALGSGGMWPRTGPSVGKDTAPSTPAAATATTCPSSRSMVRL